MITAILAIILLYILIKNIGEIHPIVYFLALLGFILFSPYILLILILGYLVVKWLLL
jgi:hypothetical protein